mgnify:CR=1 FL=1
MTTWTEAQIDRHLHLWEHRHGPDSPEAGIVRQLRAERDAARKVLERIATEEPNEKHGGNRNDIIASFAVAISTAALQTTQETPHD